MTPRTRRHNPSSRPLLRGGPHSDRQRDALRVSLLGKRALRAKTHMGGAHVLFFGLCRAIVGGPVVGVASRPRPPLAPLRRSRPSARLSLRLWCCLGSGG